MGVTITTPSPFAILTTKARLKTNLGITSTSDDAMIDEMVREASAAVEAYCNRIFSRQVYSEVVESYGGPYQPLYHAPVQVLASSTYNGSTVTDVSISDKDQGLLFKQNGFNWTAQSFLGLLGGGRFLDFGHPIPQSEEKLWTFAYTAGYIVPSQNILSSNKMFVLASDDSFNSIDAGFPSLLKSGDIIETSGFDDKASNGRFQVTGTPTTSKVVITSTDTLVAQTTSTGSSATVLFQNIPRDVERAVLEMSKTIYANRAKDSSIISRTAGPLSITHTQSNKIYDSALPPAAIGYLRRYVRVHI